MGLVTLTFDFDLETGVPVASKVGTLGLWVLKLFAMYATDGRTGGQKQRLLSLSLRAAA